MIKVGLPSALVYGSSLKEGQHNLMSTVYSEENLLEHVIVYSRNDSSNFFNDFSELGPDLIITIGSIKAGWEHIAIHSDQKYINTKWLHYEKEPTQEELANYIAVESTNWACNSLNEIYNSVEEPYFSVFTGAYKTDKQRIMRSYQSLANQTYKNWEWTIVDDSPEDYTETWEILTELSKKDYRVKIHRIQPVSGGNIGLVKNRAASLSNGNYLLEMDHDDALISTCFEDIKYAIEQYPDAGFFYTNVAEPYEDGEMRQYTKTIGTRDEWYANPQNSFVWGYGGHEWVYADGKKYLSHYYPNINPKTIRFNIGMPNHARIWQRDAYNKVSKHNKFISVTDDFELIVRTFLNTTMVHIPKLLYLQYNNRNSTVDNNRKDINRKARLIKDFYDKQIHDRIIELGYDDFEWNDDLQRANPLQNDMQDLQFFENENVLNKIAMIKETKKRPTLAFATMCKNEEHIIGTVLDAVAPYIDYLVVADNGSTDRTLEIVQEFMDRTGIPGEIHEDEWFGFDVNKNMMMEYVHGKTDYVLHLDADDIMAGDFSFNMEDVGYDNYLMTMKRGTSTWKATVIYDNSLRWKFCGAAHTIIKCIDKPEGYSTGDLSDRGYVIADGVGSRAFDPKKFLYDAERLTNQFWNTLTDDPDGLFTRSVFYTAQSYMDYGKEDSYEQALKWNKLYLRLKDTWIEEAFEAQMRISLCMMKIERYTKNEIVDEMEKAIAMFPDRAEPYVRLGGYLNRIGDHHLAYHYLTQAKDMNLEEVKKKYILFVDNTCYGDYINDELSVACYWTGRYERGLNLINEIVNDERFEAVKPRLLENINHFNNRMQDKQNQDA